MKYFGTDGFRGEANLGLNVDHAYMIGRFLGSRKTSGGGKIRCVIGKDTRRSGYMFEYALTAGLTASGADVFLLHVASTPNVSYTTSTGGFDFGIMITASHNPFYDNGIKIVDGSGYKMEDAILEEIEAYIDGKANAPLATGKHIGYAIDYAAGRELYKNWLVSIIERPKKGFKIALDCANGAASRVAPAVFRALGPEPLTIGDRPDGFNINAGFGSTHMEALQSFVLESGADFGFAFDGDADRCILVNQRGVAIDGDVILYMCAKHLKARGKLKNNKVSATIMSNMGLFKALARTGVECDVTPVGDKYITQSIFANDLSIGAEQSGHVVFSDYEVTGDGVLTALMLLNIAESEGADYFNNIYDEYAVFPQTLKNIRVNDKAAAQEDEDVRAAVFAANASLGENGRLLLRASGTEPVIRVMAEAGSAEVCDKWVENVTSVMREKGHIIE